MVVLRNTASHAEFLKSAWPCKSAQLAMHICSKRYAPNARSCKGAQPAVLFFNFVSNYTWLCTYARPAMHNCCPPISSLLVFPRLLQPSFLLKAQVLAHHRGFELRFFEFGSRHLKRVGLAKTTQL